MKSEKDKFRARSEPLFSCWFISISWEWLPSPHVHNNKTEQSGIWNTKLLLIRWILLKICQKIHLNLKLIKFSFLFDFLDIVKYFFFNKFKIVSVPGSLIKVIAITIKKLDWPALLPTETGASFQLKLCKYLLNILVMTIIMLVWNESIIVWSGLASSGYVIHSTSFPKYFHANCALENKLLVYYCITSWGCALSCPW